MERTDDPDRIVYVCLTAIAAVFLICVCAREIAVSLKEQPPAESPTP